MIGVIDTSKIKNAARIFKSFAAIKAYNITSKKLKDSSYAEFLVWDELVADVDVVSYEALRKPYGPSGERLQDLFELFPFLRSMNQKESKLGKLRLKSNVDWMRQRLYPYSQEQSAIKDEGRHFKAIGRKKIICGKRVAIWSMEPRRFNEFIEIARLFRPHNQLAILVSFLSMMTTIYHKDDMMDMVVPAFRSKLRLLIKPTRTF